MVNPGHASRACTTCKVRRIRCDCARPTCLRCIKSKRICLGYDTQNAQPRNGHYGAYSNLTAMGQPNVPQPLARDDHPRAHMTSALAKVILLFDNLTTNTTADFVSSSSLLNSMFATDGPGRTASVVLNVIRNGIFSLKQPLQSIAERRAQLAQYNSATQELRAAIATWPASSALSIAAFTFALYEMIMNLDQQDKIWQIHLDGMLTLLRNTPREDKSISLVKAMDILNTGDDVHEVLASAAMDGFKGAYLLVDVSLLQLRSLSSTMDALFHDNQQLPRKLDVQKLRVAVRQIHRNLNLFPALMASPVGTALNTDGDPSNDGRSGGQLQGAFTDNSLASLWTEYRALQIVVSDFLLTSGNFTHSKGDYNDTKEFTGLSRTIREAVDGLHSAAAFHIGPQLNEASGGSPKSAIKTTQGLMLLWPLYCAFKAPGLSDGERSYFSESLWLIGERASIPKAMALATPGNEKTSGSDVLAGLLLVHLFCAYL